MLRIFRKIFVGQSAPYSRNIGNAEAVDTQGFLKNVDEIYGNMLNKIPRNIILDYNVPVITRQIMFYQY